MAQPIDYDYGIPNVGIQNTIQIGEHKVDVLMRCNKPEIVVFGNVLTPAECDAMIARAKPRIERSTIVDPLTGKQEVIAQRSSEGCTFKRAEDDFIASIEDRLAAIMQWPVENGEGFQVINYQVGGEYRPHFDYFPPDSPGGKIHIERAGQRVSTMVLYLNDVEDGGETAFTSANIWVAPKKGNAVFFRYRNQHGQLNPLSLHAGAPVKRGEKWIMTKWVRERPYV